MIAVRIITAATIELVIATGTTPNRKSGAAQPTKFVVFLSHRKDELCGSAATFLNGEVNG
jgi:hypothetical protein